MGYCQKERFWLEVHGNRVRRYDTSRLWGSTRSLWQREWDQNIRKRECIIRCMIWLCEMRWQDGIQAEIYLAQSFLTIYSPYFLSSPFSLHFRSPAVTLFITIIPVPPYTRCVSVHLHHPVFSVCLPSLSSLQTWTQVVRVVVVVVVMRHGFSRHHSSLALCAKHISPPQYNQIRKSKKTS